ncbi:hypothetical protein ACMFMF_005928 [Clarireedia jacksonii]
MAGKWKEIGIVPDSDDEEDLDSQNTIHSIHQFTSENNEFNDINDQSDIHNETDVREGNTTLNDGDEVEGADSSRASSVDLLGSPSSFPEKFEERKNAQHPSHENLLNQEEDEGQILNEAIHDPENPASQSRAPLVEQDEVSRSWVRATSPASSILSSPPRTQSTTTSNSALNIRATEPVPSSRFEPPREHNSQLHASTYVESPRLPSPPLNPAEFDAPELPRRRNLRERRLEQIHPFSLEQLKYEKRMKESRLKPVKFIQAEDRPNRKTRPIQEQDSQDTEFQDIDAEHGNTQDSQSMNPDRSSPPLSASTVLDDEIQRNNNIETSHTGHDVHSDSDQELPDLPDLFRKPLVGIAPNSKSKPSKRVYTTKNRINMPKPSLLQTQHHGAEANVRERDIFNFPGSSPSSSPPIRSANTRKPISRVLSNSSIISASPLGQSSPMFQILPEAFTPATSAKMPGGTSPVNLVSDDEDHVSPPATDWSLSASEMSDGEETAILRRLKKKMKHVLPASHLRLDQRDTRLREQRLQVNDTRNVEEVRAGVARPIMRRQTISSVQSHSTSRMLSIESDESDDDSNKNQSIQPYDSFEALPLPPGSNLGYAVEEDRIDHMLPTISRKRKANGSLSQRKVKRQIHSTSSHVRGERNLHQPRITAHLAVVPDSPTDHAASTLKRRRPRKAPPKLSILDYTNTSGPTDADVPQFLKVASRTARSRKTLGRQSPTRKFIRLATREDTADALAVLSDWRTSKIQPRAIAIPEKEWENNNRYPLGLISGNLQAESSLKAIAARSNPRAQMASLAGRRKVLVSKTGQRSLSDFITIEEEATQRESPPMRTTSISSGRNIQFQRKRNNHRARPTRLAQLEASEIEYTRQFPSESFKSNVKVLDSLYRRGRRRPVPQSNLQMSRFLADDEILQRPPEPIPMEEDNSISIPVLPVVDVDEQRRRRKRSPKHIDARAAVYRQPSEPPILSLTTDNSAVTNQGRLFNLGKIGTKYSRHFDILPLMPGVYFHETTFLGSGRLADALTDSVMLNIDGSCPISLKMGDEKFTWGTWDERVSEQMGIFIDWIFDQLNVTPQTDQAMGQSDLVEATTQLISYVQHSKDFVKADSEVDYLLQMSDILRDFSSRLNSKRTSFSTMPFKQTIQVTTRFSVLVMQLLRISRSVQHPSTVSFETSLKKITGSCIRLLLFQGLDNVRKLYDDLQYLSVRGNGIRNDKFFVESWVIIYHVLGAAQISRASFWDLTNIELGIESMSEVHDANRMENLWLSMFTLLPLSAFDPHGAVVTNTHQELSSDNWPLVQALLKQVFKLYRGNDRQSPGFNDYCRAIISRCHYLMQEWGWWNCSEIVKTLFDFFTSMKLSNLRHEEVYKSPRFLEELDKEPSLDLEPGERCFHIFLKLVAMAVKHMRASGDIKSVRNLVARLSPNHDRQYPKEEEIHQHDLASLRNHHDLLCTLYWSAPYRLGPSVGLLQNLVSAESSHNAAFLINLRAWTNLSRYVLSSSPTNFCIDAYEPFLAWQNCFFNNLLDYYLQVETIARGQIESLPQCSRHLSENRIQSTIDTNRMSTMYSIQAVARGMIEAMKSATSTTLKHAINFDMISKMLANGSLNDKIGRELISCAIDVLVYYFQRLRTIELTLTAQQTSDVESEEFDSQGFGNDRGFEDAVKIWQFVEDFLDPIDQKYKITSIFCNLVREAIYSTTPPDGSIGYAFIERLVKCWADLTCFLTKFGRHPSKAFFISGTEAIFDNRAESTLALVAWPLFLSEVIEHSKALIEVPSFDFGLEWVVAISKPEQLLRWENVLTCQLMKQNHFLVSVESLNHDTMVTKMLNHQPSAVMNQQLLIGAIKKIQQMYSDKTLLSSTFPSMPAASIKDKFSTYLEAIVTSMQHHLRHLHNTNNSAHKSYVLFVQNIVSQIHSHSRDIYRLPDFFFQRSPAYWPPVNDPKLYLAGIIGYSLELSANLAGTRNRLFHYLWNGLVNSLLEYNTLATYIAWMMKAGGQLDFLQFLLTDMAPSALEVAFEERAGWLISDIYLVAVSRSLTKLLDGTQPVGRFIHYTTALLQQMLNGLNGLYGRYGHGIEAIHPNHQGIITVICRFWRACRPHLMNYNVSFKADMDEVLEAFDEFTEAGMACFGNDLDINLRFKRFNLGKVGNDVAVKAMTLEVQKNWSVAMVRGREMVRVKLNDGKLAYHGCEQGPQNLKEVLEGALPAVDVVSRSSLPFF